VAIAASAVTVLFLPLQGAEPVDSPVFPPRAVEGVAHAHDEGKGQVLMLSDAAGAVPNEATRLPLIMIDGNRDGNLVLFNHDGHKERMGGETSCAVCHHLNMPFDRNTSCYECHRDMYEPTSVFNHASHVDKLGGNDSCSECHSDYTAEKKYDTATACTQCHEHETVPEPIIRPPGERWRNAAGYEAAMHRLCITCHQKELEQSPGIYSTALDQCEHCHDADWAREIDSMAPGKTTNREAQSGTNESRTEDRKQNPAESRSQAPAGSCLGTHCLAGSAGSREAEPRRQWVTRRSPVTRI
jgi:hypothetical protein